MTELGPWEKKRCSNADDVLLNNKVTSNKPHLKTTLWLRGTKDDDDYFLQAKNHVVTLKWWVRYYLRDNQSILHALSYARVTATATALKLWEKRVARARLCAQLRQASNSCARARTPKWAFWGFTLLTPRILPTNGHLSCWNASWPSLT